MVVFLKSLLDLKGVGPKIIENFNKLGIDSIDDLIYYYPKRYDVLMRTDMRYVADKERVIIDGIVESKPTLVSVSPSLKKILFRIIN